MPTLREKRLFLLDMDGTIYLDDRLFDGVIPFLHYIRQVGGRYLFLTNNSSRGVEGYMEKMRRLGIETEKSDYLTSVDVSIAALQKERPGKKCYVFGTRSFYAQLESAGIPVTDRPDPDVDILLCGFDRELTFQKLEDACILLNRGAEFWATNPDWVCPTWYGSVPDCGSVCRMLTTATAAPPAFWVSPGRTWCIFPWPAPASPPPRRCFWGTGSTRILPAASMPVLTRCSFSPARGRRRI